MPEISFFGHLFAYRIRKIIIFARNFNAQFIITSKRYLDI